MIEDALKYHSEGYRIIPIAKGGKRPILTDWTNSHLTEADIIRYWKDTRNNIAIITDGVTVVDIDDTACLDWAVDKFGETDRVGQSGSGGIHLWYQGESSGNRVRIEGKAVDIRSGKGGCVLVEPSFTIGKYQWLKRGEMAAVMQMPEKKYEPMPTAKGDRYMARNYISKIRSISGEGGDKQLFRAACALTQKFNLSEKEALEELVIWNSYNAEPPWHYSRLVYKVKESWRLKDAR